MIRPMSRKQRITLPGVPQHVVQRGNNKQACFFNEADYYFFLAALYDGLENNACQLHAFILMTNHVHLLVTPTTKDGVSLLMRDLGRKYVRYINDTYGRTGTLWEGRFKSSMVDSERYCLACYRYIELNPVVAKMVPVPEDYPWSSFHTNALGETSDLIFPHATWLSLGETDEERQKAYRELCEEKLSADDVEALRYGTRKQLPVGSPEFKANIESTLSVKLGTGKRGRPIQFRKRGQVELISTTSSR